MKKRLSIILFSAIMNIILLRVSIATANTTHNSSPMISGQTNPAATVYLQLDENDKGKGKWGFIDEDGNLLIYPAYDYVGAFYKERALVYIGSVDFMGYPKEGKYGFINKNGEIVIPIVYNSAKDFNSFGQAIVKEQDYYGIIDIEGKTVIPFEYTNISFSQSNNLYIACITEESNSNQSKRNVYYFIDPSGTITQFGFESPIAENGCLTVYSQDHDFQCALFSANGKQCTDYVYDDLKNFSEGIGRYKRGEKYGLITTSGIELTEPIFDQVGFVHNGQVVVQKNDKYCLSDINGNIIQEYNADEIRMYDSLEYGVLCAKKGNAFYIMTPDGEYISRGYKHTIVFEKNNMFYELENGVHYIIDSSGKEEVLPIECSDIKIYNDNRVFAYKNGLYALIDLEGNLITDFVWKDIIINTDTSDELIGICY